MINQMKKHNIFQTLASMTKNNLLLSLLKLCKIMKNLLQNMKYKLSLLLENMKLYLILKPNEAHLIMFFTFFVLRNGIAYCDIISDIAWWLGTGGEVSEPKQTELDDTIIPYIPQIIIDAAAWVGGIENLEESNTSSDSSSNNGDTLQPISYSDVEVPLTNKDIPDSTIQSIQVTNLEADYTGINVPTANKDVADVAYANTNVPLANPDISEAVLQAIYPAYVNALDSYSRDLITLFKKIDYSQCDTDESRMGENINFMVEKLADEFFAAKKEDFTDPDFPMNQLIEEIYVRNNVDANVKAHMHASILAASLMQLGYENKPEMIAEYYKFHLETSLKESSDI